MTHKKDIDLLIDAHDEAIGKRNAIAVKIADDLCAGRVITDAILREYRFARLGVESTARDLENCIAIAATVVAEDP